MPQPAPQRLGIPSPNAIVTVTAGVAYPQTVTIPSKGVVQFNADGQDYLIQLWDKKNEKHPAVCVYLAANSSIYVVGDPSADDQNANCAYNVLNYSGAGGGIIAAGGNKIIIGSGPDPNS
ncbi:MAG TPA: hypothetical protein VN749_05285 [Candidatus Eisenbacteria bacterium]|nr:hypothetical protein [Candidatus Eisenbacteria bacterium]